MDLKRQTRRPRKTLPDAYRVELTDQEITEASSAEQRALELGIQAGKMCLDRRVKPNDTVVSPLYDEHAPIDSVYAFLEGLCAVRGVGEMVRRYGNDTVHEALAVLGAQIEPAMSAEGVTA